MTTMRKFFVLLVLMAFSINFMIGQEPDYIKNVDRYLTLDSTRLVIKYDLPSPDTTQLFDIILKIYYKDQVIQPQDSTLTGAWGNKVAPGIEKVIMWDFPNEFEGDINRVTIEVVARPTSGPIAEFGFNLPTKPPFEVVFDNKSKNADFYSWKFGDSKSKEKNLSSLENPVHKFKSAGTYNVELTAGSSTTKATSIIEKTVELGQGDLQDLQKHKKMKTIWLGSAVASAGIGTIFVIRSVKLDNQFRTEPDPVKGEELQKGSKTSMIIGSAALAVTATCIPLLIIETKKVRAIQQNMSVYITPLDRGGEMGMVWNF